VPTDREQRLWLSPWQLEFKRSAATTETQRTHAAGDTSIHRIIGWAHYWAVVMQKNIGDIVEPAFNFAIVR
jgi:hypothetical protein